MGGSAFTEAVQTTVGPLYDKFEVVRIVGFFVLKKSVFEPRSQRINPKIDLYSSD